MEEEQPQVPAEPEQPAEEEQPQAPVEPEQPVAEEQPQAPAEPEQPAEEEQPQVPAEPEQPAEEQPAEEQQPSDGPTLDTENTDRVLSDSGDYYIYQHAVYGKYIDASEFGTDTSGKEDSLAAINRALAAAHQENAAVYLSGKLYVSDQIVLNETNSGVTALFGAGMGETIISFDKPQVGVYNSNTNQDDVRAYAGILIDGQSNKTIAELSVQYTNDDFYRAGESYFGKVNGIMVNDADNTLISKVEVSGANRAGVFFTSTETLQRDPNSTTGRTYKARLILGEVDESYEHLPLGSNNRIEDSHLHHNRVAGALFGYQENFVADNNVLAWNGHEADGGTGYGIAAMAGSYNLGITFTHNHTDHNYRKGLDVHDGNNIVIENNTAIGDRLHGIAVYNRQFTMDNVKISNNVIVQDPSFRLEVDDNPSYTYHGYSAIQLQTNTQFKNLHSADNGYFEISNNKIEALTLYKNSLHTYAIEFRNHEQSMDYTLNIANNEISGDSTKYLIAVINNTQNQLTGENGLGSGTINIVGNQASIGTVASGTVPIYIEEKNTNGILRGEVTLMDNQIVIREQSNGAVEGVQVIGNAEQYHIINNIFELHGTMDKSIVSIHGRGMDKSPTLNVSDNDIVTDIASSTLYRGWLEYRNADVLAEGNTHNGNVVANVYHNTNPSLLSTVALSSASPVAASSFTLSDLLEKEELHVSNLGESTIIGLGNQVAPAFYASSLNPAAEQWQYDIPNIEMI